ncbi:MAG: cyanophycinase [Pseudomonadota bacterium]
MKTISCYLIGLVSLAWASASAEPGRLVIAGGAVDERNAPVWQAFENGLPESGLIYIVPSASSSPAGSAEFAMQALIAHGVSPDRIEVAPLALRDDEDTPDTDESDWRKNASDPKLAASLRTAVGFWFTGGDQLRTTELLLADGDTPVLSAIRAAHQDGASIGGTSAGAAIMSELMIFGGNSFSAFFHPPAREDGKGLLVTRGLGFFPYGVVDQHFGERARLGRLIRSLDILPDTTQRIGFGIDEGTALIVDFPARLSVVGEGYVTVVDATEASFTDHPDGYRVENLLVHLLGAEDQLDLASGGITPAAHRKATLDAPYYDEAQPNGGGMAFGTQMLSDVIGDALIDNSATQDVFRDSFTDQGAGLRYRFRQTSSSAGFWGRDAEGRAQYTVTGIRMSVVPISVRIEEITF